MSITLLGVRGIRLSYSPNSSLTFTQANPGHPLGVRGVGEVPLVPPMAAVANAISHAIGVRTNRLPMNPGSLLEALWEKERNGS